ncbi:MAG: PfkB family carbohydrate kinase [Treponema sp.]|jgi:sugar/nucleoside kinase (ribokinase family)|nr:PfkB family carbohydrate kinase [Treponema sp.]
MLKLQVNDEDKKLEMLCVGRALVDIFVKVNNEQFRKIGIIKLRHIEYEKLLGILGHFPDSNVVSGGGAANVAKVAALLGIRAGYIGAVGPDDEFAKVFEREMESAGVTLFLIKERKPTGACVFLQRKGEPNVIAASISAADLLKASDVREDAIKQARIVVIDGYILNREDLVSRILELASEYGTVVALDVGSVEMAETYARDIMRYCKEYPLLLFMNKEEAGAFYWRINGEPSEEEKEPVGFMDWLFTRRNPLPSKMQAFFQKLADDLFPVIVVKLGAKGAMVFAGGKVHREDTLAVIPKETTGAGDAFCAAFLSAWLRDKSFGECAGFGNKAAREVLDVDGTFVDRKKMSGIARLLGG